MKRGAPDHWKMTELARVMKVPQAWALPWANGVMERLWHYTARYHPQGDIGTAPDWKIAEACGLLIAKRGGRAGIDLPKCCRFVDALVTVGWLDRDAVLTQGCRSYAGGLPVPCRLLVHDWAEHCTEDVRRTLKRMGLSIFFPTIPETGNGKTPPALALALAIAIPIPPQLTQSPGAHDWFEEMYTRHPKKKDRGLAEQNLSEVAVNGFDRREFDRVHILWCAEWAKDKPQFAPTLAQWILDQGWKYPPNGHVKAQIEAHAETRYKCWKCQANPCLCAGAPQEVPLENRTPC